MMPNYCLHVHELHPLREHVHGRVYLHVHAHVDEYTLGLAQDCAQDEPRVQMAGVFERRLFNELH